MAFDYAGFRQAAIKAGVPSKQVDAVIQQKQAEEIATEGVPLEEIQTDPTLRGIQAEQVRTGEYQPKPTAAEEKISTGKEEASRILTLIEDEYFKEGGLSYGRFAGILAKGKAVIGDFPQLTAYQNLVKSVRPKFAKALGDVGNLSLPEQESAVKQIPGVRSTPEEATQMFRNMRVTFGLPERESPRQEGIVPKTLGRVLFPETKEYLQRPFEETAFGAKTLPEFLSRYAKQTTEPALEVFSAIQAGKAIKAAPSAVKGLFQIPKKIAEKQTAAVAKAGAKTVPVDDIFQAGQKYIEADPTAATYGEKVGTALKGTNLTGEQLLAKIKVWNKAYTAAGKVGKSSKAGYYNSLKQVGARILQSEFPEIAKTQKMFKYFFQLPRTASKATWTALKLSGLGKMLGL